MPPGLPKGNPDKYRHFWTWLGMPRHTQPKPAISYITHLHVKNQGNLEVLLPDIYY